MPTLSLLRHAKSSWDDPALDDHERPLSKRGTRAARIVGRHVLNERLVPDLVLCSDAVRARATLALVLAEIGELQPQIRYEGGLYMADPDTILGIVHDLPPDVAHAMVIGHNPGLHALALALSGRGDRKLVARLATGYPTAALAVLSFPGTDWRSLAPGAGRLEHFVTPRDLES